MKLVIAGGTGFVGRHLVNHLTRDGHRCTVLTRNPLKKTGLEDKAILIPWDGKTLGEWQVNLEEADAVVNLAGASIGKGRWTEKRKQTLRESRLSATHTLLEGIRTAFHKPSVMINASAVGYYGNRGDEQLNEEAAPGSGFLASLCMDWEAASKQLTQISPNTREVRLRFGVILGSESEALARMAFPFRMFAGGPLADGRHWLSWIHADDVVGLVRWTLENKQVQGPVNATSPYPTRWRDFAQAMAKVLHRPSWLPVPRTLLQLALGEMAEEMLLSSQRAVPEKVLRLGYSFTYPQAGEALTACFRRNEL